MNAWPRIRGVISDLDGVVYRGDTPIQSAVDAFRKWHAQGLPYAFVTNNSTRRVIEFRDKLQGFGIPVDEAQIVTSAEVTATVIARNHPGARVFVVGAPSLRAAVEGRGLTLASTDVEVVVVGLDREFAFGTLCIAQAALLDGAKLYATNPDVMLPKGAGYEPGAGAILRAVETASGSSAVVIGKPQPTLIEIAIERIGTARAETLMIGDQVATDIAAGQAAGVPTALVLTGVPETGPRQVEPDFVIEDLGQIPVEGPHEHRRSHG